MATDKEHSFPHIRNLSRSMSELKKWRSLLNINSLCVLKFRLTLTGKVEFPARER